MMHRWVSLARALRRLLDSMRRRGETNPAAIRELLVRYSAVRYELRPCWPSSVFYTTHGVFTVTPGRSEMDAVHLLFARVREVLSPLHSAAIEAVWQPVADHTWVRELDDWPGLFL